MSSANISDWLYSFSSDAEKFKALREKFQPKKAVTISIASGKGGVGKTSIAVKLAKELSKKDYKVLLIDCDFNLSNTSIKLNLPINNRFHDLLTSNISFDECLYKLDNLHILPAANGNLDIFHENFQMYEVIIDIIYSHEEDYDYIILDSPAGISKDSVNLSAYCNYRLIVATPDRSSITDSYSLIKLLAKNYEIKENHLIVNMLSHKKQFAKVVQTISETAENFLNVRTQVLGGLKKYDFPTDCFDKYFIETEDSSAHKDFAKLVSSFTEKISRRYHQGMLSQSKTTTESALFDIQ